MSQPAVYLAAAVRTPIGAFQGSLAPLRAPELGAVAIRQALACAKLSADAVDEVYMGNVLGAAVGQAPARQAMKFAGLPDSVPATTVGKVCGSGMQAIILGARAIATGDCDIVVAGGMESMSNVPYYLEKARTGYRLGDGQLRDGLILDGLWDPYTNQHMGNCGDACAKEHAVSRDAQDAFARESFRRALAAAEAGSFRDEIAPVTIPQKKGASIVVAEDEGPKKGDPTKFASLRPAFSPDGTITAANASSINDGASAVVLVGERALAEHNLSPLARIVGYAGHAGDPVKFTTAPAFAIERVCKKAGIAESAIGLYEINEAFAVVTMVCTTLRGLDPARVNVRGGAVALGHPIGATGARIVTTLVHAMRQGHERLGLATLCIGGGEALAMILETT